MTKNLFALLLLISIVTACKKDEKPYTVMTAVVNGDSTWTTNAVSVYATGSNIVAVSGRDPATGDRINLGLFGFREGRKTYDIVYQGIAVTVNGSSAEYIYGSSVAVAATGSISVTQYNAKTIEGNFDFTGPGGHVSGTFIAPKP